MHSLITRPIAQPAAGADWAIVPSNSDSVLLRSITGKLVTGSATGNRAADLLTTNENGDAIARDIAPINHGPSTTMLYSWRPGNALYGTDAEQPTAFGGPSSGAGVQSESAAGQVTAPALGAAVATLAAPGAGTYTIQVQASFIGGAPTAAADSLNLELKVGANVIGVLPPIPITATGSAAAAQFNAVAVPAATAVTVNAIAAGTAGVIYAASIIATQESFAGTGALAAGSCPGFWLPNGSQVASVTANLAAADQWSALIASFLVADELGRRRVEELLEQVAGQGGP